MAEFKCRDITPRGGWKYFERETRQWFTGTSLDNLVGRVQAHREWKGLDVETTEADIIEQVCMRHGPDFCRKFEEYYPNRIDLITADKLALFNKTAFNFIKSGGELISDEEAERRAEICRSCPFNVSAQGCACSVFYKALGALVPGARTKPGLEICSVCGCALKAKVWLPLETIDNGDTRFPAWCWQCDH